MTHPNLLPRRHFLQQSSALALGTSAAAGTLLDPRARADDPPKSKPSLIWANLLHLGTNMWCDWSNPATPHPNVAPSKTHPSEKPLWGELTNAMADAGMNLLVIDLGEGVRYDSHPELAVDGSWTPAQLRDELARLRAKGIEPIPKLNFSASHDAWLGPYARMLSTDTYYSVCKNLIAEVSTLFDKPRFFHLGMDEETAEHQINYEYVVIRQHDLWWRDFLFLVDQVEKAGPRPWIWSDYIWKHKDTFLNRMPKSVVQSNWYYGRDFGPDRPMSSAYDWLAAAGYDQIPTGSNWSIPDNFALTVDYGASHIPADHLLGFLQTPWKPTLTPHRDHHLAAIAQVQQARSRLNARPQ
jgi:hypothetical protein